MNMPATADVDDATRDALAGLALGDPEVLLEGLELRAEMQENSGLDPRSFAFVKIAALIALDAPPASYLRQVGNADRGRAARHRTAGRRAEDRGCSARGDGRPRPDAAGGGLGTPGNATTTPGEGPPPSMLDQLSQLTTLHQQGALTEAEFAAAKAKLLG